jgi:hypothetical protein
LDTSNYYEMNVSNLLSTVRRFDSCVITVRKVDRWDTPYYVEALCHSRLSKRIGPLLDACEVALQDTNLEQAWERRTRDIKFAQEKVLAKKRLWESILD